MTATCSDLALGMSARGVRAHTRDRVNCDSHPANGICTGCCAIIDAGDGPRTVLISSVDVVDYDVVRPDSALGRALIGAQPGARVRVRALGGPRMVRVIAVEN